MKNTNNNNAAGRLDIPKGTYIQGVMVARVVARRTQASGSVIPKDMAEGVLESHLMAQFIGTQLSTMHRQRVCPHMFWNNGDGTWICMLCELVGYEDGEGDTVTGVNL